MHIYISKVLANLTAMGSESFAKEKLPDGKSVGKVDVSEIFLK
jgi:hypothetical protein